MLIGTGRRTIAGAIAAWMLTVAASDAQGRSASSDAPAQRGVVTVGDATAALRDAAPDPAGPMPIGGVAQWFGGANYPPAALRAAAQGRVVAGLSVDARGRVTDCVIRQSSGSAALDKATCDVARQRASFTPAHDAGGRAVAGDYSLPVRWRLPSVPPVDATVATTLISIGPDGAVLSCAAVQPSPLGSICGAFPVGRKLDVAETLRGRVIAVATMIRPLAE